MTIIHVTTKPAQKRDQLWRDGDTLIAHIKGVPKDGEANAYLEKFLAEAFGVPKSSVTITKGHTSRHKTVQVNMEQALLQAKILAIPETPQQRLV
jgi:uncharacterized protein (TIGR00251 family)